MIFSSSLHPRLLIWSSPRGELQMSSSCHISESRRWGFLCVFFFPPKLHLGAYIFGFYVVWLFSGIVVQRHMGLSLGICLFFWNLLICYPECYIVLLNLHPHLVVFWGKCGKGWEMISCLFKAACHWLFIQVCIRSGAILNSNSLLVVAPVCHSSLEI